MIKNLEIRTLLISVLILSALSDVALGQSHIYLTKIGNGAKFTQEERNFMQLVLDDLCRIGSIKTAQNLNYYIAQENATIAEDEGGVYAIAGRRMLPGRNYGYNELSISQLAIAEWKNRKVEAAYWNKKKNDEKTQENLFEARVVIRTMAFTIIHEDVHMHQELPREIPKFENPAWSTAIGEQRRVIIEEMAKIRKIRETGAINPGEDDLLDDLTDDLILNCRVYNRYINDLKEKIIFGTVDEHVFRTSEGDMESLIQDAKNLIENKKTDYAASCEFIDLSKLKEVNHPREKYYIDNKGAMQGPYFAYWDEAHTEILTKGCYLNDNKTGRWDDYREGGGRYSTKYYKDGKENGRYILYYENGKISEDRYYKDGKRTGSWIYYFENGNKSVIQEYSDDNKMTGRWVSYWEDGITPKIETYYKDDKLNGRYTIYYKNGKPEKERYYKDGKETGKWIWYFENGKKSGIGEYSDGKRTGRWESYLQDGTTVEEGDYKDGLKTGRWINYRISGKRESEGDYKDGLKTGRWTYYGTDGKTVVWQEDCVNGKCSTVK